MTSQASPTPVQATDRLDEQFDRAAPRYDLLTRLNPGYHTALRRAAGALVEACRGEAATHEQTYWDVGCGSGLSTAALVESAGSSCTIIGVDASEGMLAQARGKHWPPGVSFVHAFAHDLPEVAQACLEAPADGALAAYLMRNVPAEHRDAVLATLYGQIAPGGWLVLQDYHVKGDPRATTVWTAVCRAVVTPLAAVLRGNPEIYRYLWRSVVDNDSRDELCRRLERVGFTDISFRTHPGWQRGILHTIMARRPVEAQQVPR